MAPPARPNQLDVARLAGVSRQTVSLVAREDQRVSEEKRVRVLDAMKELGYRPNMAARALAARRSMMIGLVMSDIHNPFLADLIEEIRRECLQLKLLPLIIPTRENPADEKTAIEDFIQLNVDGIIIVSAVSAPATLEEVGAQISLVLVTSNIAPANTDVVHTDDVGGLGLLAQHLHDSGYSPIVYVGYDRGVTGHSSGDRADGYLVKMAELGQEPDVRLLGEATIGSIAEDLCATYDKGFGVCCHNDLVATEFLGQLKLLGRKAGVDVGVTGFDNSSLAHNPLIGLTSMDQGTKAIAKKTIELLNGRMHGRHQTIEAVLPPHLVIRQSSRRR